MSCEMTHSLLPLYFDGELDPVTSREFERHLDTCPECQEAMSGLDTVRTQLRDSAIRFKAPNALRDKIGDTLVSASKSMRRGAAVRTWMAVAASWLIVFLVGGGIGRQWSRHEENMQAQSQFSRDLFASHWRALAATSPVDVISTDRHTVKPWFEGKIPESPTVNDFASQGFPLVGGRIDYVGDARVPTLVYRHGKHLIDVFVFPQPLPASMQGAARMQGYEIRTTALNGEYAAVVTDMGDTDFREFMQLLASKP